MKSAFVFDADPFGLKHTRHMEAQRDELLAALKGMVSIYDGVRNALTCQSVIAKLAAADTAITNAERR